MSPSYASYCQHSAIADPLIPSVSAMKKSLPGMRTINQRTETMPKAILQVSPQWFTDMLKTAHEAPRRWYDVVKNGLPSDARVVTVWTDGRDQYATINIILESAAFVEVEEGMDLPFLESPLFQIYYDEDPAPLDKHPA